MTPEMTPKINDHVPVDSPGTREIGFTIPFRFKGSRMLFDTLAKGSGDRLALIGTAG